MYCQNIILFFKINFNWRKIALPCCVGFCHTTAQISHNHAHVTLPPSLVSKESARNAGDPGLIPVSGRSAGEGNGNPLQDSCLESPMDRGASWATVHWVTKSQTRLSHTLT